MNTIQGYMKRRAIRVGLGVMAFTGITAAAAWHGVRAADSPPAPSAQDARAAAAVGAPQTVSAALASGRTSYADVVEKVAPAVVTVRVEGRVQSGQVSAPDDMLRRFFGDQFGGRAPSEPRTFRQRGLGSGVIVSPDGYILTNHHVIGGADTVRVELSDGRVLVATVVGSDEPSDVAVLKIDAANLKWLPLGNSDAVRVGDVVLTFGNPLGVGQTVTMGIISAKGRSTGLGEGGYEDFIQTDAPINQGNSGGALVNLNGELVGINSQILSPSGGNIGIGFAIPANMAAHVMTQLRTDGRVRRAQLGVTVQPVTSDLASSLGLKDVAGALVSSVAPGSAAEQAGVKRGDVILSVNGQAVNDANALRNRIGEALPGSRARLEVEREGRRQELAVTLGESSSQAAASPAERNEAARQSALGVSVAPLTPELAQQMRLPRGTQGVVIESVVPDSRASAAGLLPGDVIEEVNRKPVHSVADLRVAIQEGTGRSSLILINREGRDLFLTAPAS